MANVFLEGLILQASLIFALGSQNLFILESGLKKRHHLTVSFVCFLCDLTLILLGVAGAASLFAQNPILKILVGLLGVTFLFTYGVGKIFSKESKDEDDSLIGESSLKRSVLLAMTFSVLNPHAYLDAFILIGGFSTKYSDINYRIMLGLGAAVYSGLWFLLLSTMSSFMKPILSNPGRMRMVMSVTGLVLVYLSGKLGMDVLGWIDGEVEMNLASAKLITYPISPGQLFTSILY